MSGTVQSEASRPDAAGIDTASFIAAVFIVVALLAALWAVNHLLGSAEEIKKTAEILLPVAAIPSYNAISNFFRQRAIRRMGGEPAARNQNLFSAAFVIALIIIFLFELLAFLAGMAGGMIVAQLQPGSANMQTVGTVFQTISLLVNMPVMLLFCGGAGWMLARTRISRPFLFSLYFFVSTAVLSLFDIAVLALDQGAREMFDVGNPGAFIGFVLGALVLRPLVMSLVLLLGFWLKLGWLSLSEYFGGASGAAAA